MRIEGNGGYFSFSCLVRVLALWLFGLLGLFGLPPASLYLSGVVGISLGFVIRSLARWKRKRTHGTDVS